MSVLSAAQSAGIRLLGVKPGSLFANTDQFAMELGELATDVAVDIMKGYDWQALTKLATLTGDGAAVQFNLPVDYDRMPVKAKVHSKAWNTASFYPARDLDEWIVLQDTNWSGRPGTWIVLGGKMQIFPAISSAETARFYYISSYIATNKKAFTADADTFALPERLLTLGLIWRWRAQKRMEYAEDMATYEKALSEEILHDKGSKMIVAGRRSRFDNVHIAYPGQLG